MQVDQEGPTKRRKLERHVEESKREVLSEKAEQEKKGILRREEFAELFMRSFEQSNGAQHFDKT